VAARAQDGPRAHQVGVFFLVVQGQDVAFHFAGPDAFHTAIKVAVVAVHLGRNGRDDGILCQQIAAGIAHDDAAS